MKVKIKRRFRDKDTLQIMKVGDHADYKQERAIELAGWGFVELLEAVEEKADVPPAEEVGNIDVVREDYPRLVQEVPMDNEKPNLTIEKEDEPEEEIEKEEIPDEVKEKKEISPFPEKSEQSGPKKRGRKPKQ